MWAQRVDVRPLREFKHTRVSFVCIYYAAPRTLFVVFVTPSRRWTYMNIDATPIGVVAWHGARTSAHRNREYQWLGKTEFNGGARPKCYLIASRRQHHGRPRAASDDSPGARTLLSSE